MDRETKETIINRIRKSELKRAKKNLKKLEKQFREL